MATSDLDCDTFVKKFHIPDYIFVPNSSPDCSNDIPECPVLVFINSKSGGQLGGDLLVTYQTILNKNQVFDLGEEAPHNVLRKLYGNLERLKLDGDDFATNLERNLKIVEKKNPGIDSNYVLSFLDKVQKAKKMKIDSWHILIRVKVLKGGSCDPIAPLELPHPLHAFHRLSSTDALNVKAVSHSLADFGITSAWVWMHKFLMHSILNESYIQKNSRTSWLIRVHMQSLDAHKDGSFLLLFTLLRRI